MNYKVKICGITNIGDALAAVDAGADYIGLIFVESSPRNIDLRAAKSISAKLGTTRACKLVGVFQNANQDFVNTVKNAVGLDYVQLHGEESPDLCRSHSPSIKAVHSVQEALRFAGNADLLLIDRPKSNSKANWIETIAGHPALHSIPPFLLAGGLTPGNLGAAIECLAGCAGLIGLDVASGVESSPGQKDHKKINEFCSIARAAGGKHASTR